MVAPLSNRRRWGINPGALLGHHKIIGTAGQRRPRIGLPWAWSCRASASVRAPWRTGFPGCLSAPAVAMSILLRLPPGNWRRLRGSRKRAGPTNREIDMTKAFLTITCAAATMTAILLVSSGDALASKANRVPDRGGETILRKNDPGTAHFKPPQRLYNSTKGRATSGKRELWFLPCSGRSVSF